MEGSTSPAQRQRLSTMPQTLWHTKQRRRMVDCGGGERVAGGMYIIFSVGVGMGVDQPLNHTRFAIIRRDDEGSASVLPESNSTRVSMVRMITLESKQSLALACEITVENTHLCLRINFSFSFKQESHRFVVPITCSNPERCPSALQQSQVNLSDAEIGFSTRWRL